MMQGEGGGLLFFQIVEFIIVLNCLAVASWFYDVKIVAFCIMENHLHIILYCRESDCQCFINSFRISLTKKMMHHRDSFGRYGARGTQCVELRTERDIKDAIAYCLRNPLHHKITKDIWNHPWSSIRLYFRNTHIINAKSSPINPVFIRQFLPEHFDLPENWQINDQGLVLPDCYVDTSIVENLFHTKGEFADYLNETTDIEKKNNSDFEYERPTARHTDNDVISFVSQYIKDSFHSESPIYKLTLDQKYEIADYLYNNDLIDSITQLSRVLGLPKSTLNYRRASHSHPVSVSSSQ